MAVLHVDGTGGAGELSDDRGRGGAGVPPVWRAVLAADSGLVGLAGRLSVTGAVPRRPRGGPLLLVANHIGVFDPLVLMAACRRIGLAPRFMIAGGLLDAPVLGPVLRAGGHVRIDRGSGSALAQFARATDVVRGSALPLLVYPEGRISHDPGLWPERGKTGAARLALAAGATVIPISQWGAHEAVFWGTETVTGLADIVPLARSGLTCPLRRPTFLVHFGTPVDLSDLRAGAPGAAMRAHERIMRTITDGLVPLRETEPDRPSFHDPTRPTDGTSPWKPGRC